jgi:hypothetical protein
VSLFEDRADSKTLRAFVYVMLVIAVVGLALYFFTSPPTAKTELEGIPAVQDPAAATGEQTTP